MVHIDIEKSLTTIFHAPSVIIFEGTEVFDASFSCAGDNLPEYEIIKSFLLEFPSRDIINLNLSYLDDRDITLNGNELEKEYQLFCEGCDDEDEININFNIDKNVFENRLSIYSFSHFTEWILGKGILELMQEFNRLLKSRNNLIFQLYDRPDVLLSTATLIFTHADTPTELDFDRFGRLRVVQTTSNFQNCANCELIPEDFHFTLNSPKNPFNDIFRRIEMYLSMIYLSDISYIDDREYLNLQVTGHLTKYFSYSLIDQIDVNNEIFKIYNWVYTDGNPIDKVIIARNIISLHCRTTDLFSIDEKTFGSIRSNYALYLKDNVSHYLELKSKIAEYLTNLITQCGELFVGLFDRFTNNVIAYFTFMIAVFLANIIQQNSIENIFTNEITLLSYLIIVGSIGYLLVSIFEMNFQIKKVQSGYTQLKEEYKGVFDEEDLTNVFKNDQIFNDAISEIKK